jgi:four helix bundle protein
MTNGTKYDLKERTFKFSQSIISFCGKIPRNPTSNPIISQLVRAGTSIGANYAEADEAPTKRDFINKLSIAHKEISETKYWLRVVVEVLPEDKKVYVNELSKEVQELNLIFAAIIRKSKANTHS